MGNIAKGIAKTLVMAPETTYGELADNTTGYKLRRRTSRLTLNKDTFQNDEIASHQQVADYSHGTLRAQAQIDGLLSPGTYKNQFAAAMRKVWTAGASFVASSGNGITVNAGTKTMTRQSGSWITDGFKVGDVVRPTGLDSAINGKNLRIASMTALNLVFAEAPGASVASPNETCTIAVAGKKLWIPMTGHTEDSFNMQHHYADRDTVEVGLGMMMNTMEIGLPATGNSTLGMQMLGQTVIDDPNGDGSAPYFQNPTAETTTRVLTAPKGKLRLGGSDIAVCTGLTLTINDNLTGDPVVGSEFIPEMFPGRVMVSGQGTFYYTDGSLWNDFKNETELSLQLLLTLPGSGSHFMNFVMNRIKLNGADKDDGEKGIIQTVPFVALLKDDGGTGTAFDATTLAVQDTAA